jgi:hypothetical protein
MSVSCECCVSECDLETSTMRRPRPTLELSRRDREKINSYLVNRLWLLKDTVYMTLTSARGKLSPCLFKQHAMKTCGGTEV